MLLALANHTTLLITEASLARIQASQNVCRNAGETKGVTMEMNRKQLAELKKLLNLAENRYCADCIGGGAAARASWASINLGVFLCMRCAGAHRGLGTHISKVKRGFSPCATKNSSQPILCRQLSALCDAFLISVHANP